MKDISDKALEIKIWCNYIKLILNDMRYDTEILGENSQPCLEGTIDVIIARQDMIFDYVNRMIEELDEMEVI